MELNGKRELPIANFLINYQNETFVIRKASDDVWNEFSDCWEYFYKFLLDAIRFDLETPFVPMEFWENAKDVCPKIQVSNT